MSTHKHNTDDWKIIAQYRHEKEAERHRYEKEWYEKHCQADVLVVNQNGVPLYAVYKHPAAGHEESVAHLFKTLRAQKYFEDEL